MLYHTKKYSMIIILFWLSSIKYLLKFIFSCYISTYVVASTLPLVWESKKYLSSGHLQQTCVYPWLRTLYLTPHSPPTPAGKFINEFCLLSSQFQFSGLESTPVLSSRFYPSFTEPLIICLCSVGCGRYERNRWLWLWVSVSLSLLSPFYHWWRTWGFPFESS